MGPSRPRSPARRWVPLRVLAAYGLGAVLVTAPADALDAAAEVDLTNRPLVAIVPNVSAEPNADAAPALAADATGGAAAETGAEASAHPQPADDTETTSSAGASGVAAAETRAEASAHPQPADDTETTSSAGADAGGGGGAGAKARGGGGGGGGAGAKARGGGGGGVEAGGRGGAGAGVVASDRGGAGGRADDESGGGRGSGEAGAEAGGGGGGAVGAGSSGGGGGGGDGGAEAEAEAEAEAGGRGSGGFVLDRDGQVIRVGGDGSLAHTATLHHYSTPVGTAVAGRAVFGGVRCGGDGCDRRIAELAVLDPGGAVASTVEVDMSSGWPPLLNGMALVGTDSADGADVWVNAGGRLHRVAVGRSTGEARVVEDVPWPGGEPCVIGGGLHDLAATGGITGRQGAWVGDGPAGATPPFRLVLRRWTGDRWELVAGVSTTMFPGQNAYCVPGGYEVRDGTATVARWTPAASWHDPTGTTTTIATGRPAELAGLAGPPVVTPPDAGGPSASPPAAPWAVDHVNMCSAACGPEVRARTRDMVAWLAERHRPAALSLNEACYDDAVHLSGRLTTLTVGAGYSALDTAVGCPGAVKRFGNLVLVDAGLAPRAAWWHPFRTQAARAGEPCDHRRNECRGMVCVEAAPATESPASRVFCSAHLESPRRAREVAEAQAREYVTRVDARFAGRGSRVLAGDFNLARSVTDEIFAPLGYRAAPAGATIGVRPEDTEEIDRIYDDGRTGSARAARLTASGATVTSYCDPKATDHCYMTTAPPTSPT